MSKHYYVSSWVETILAGRVRKKMGEPVAPRVFLEIVETITVKRLYERAATMCL